MSRTKKRRHRDYMLRDDHLVEMVEEGDDKMIGGGMWDQATLDEWDEAFGSQIHRAPAGGPGGYAQWLKDSKSQPGGAITKFETCWHVQEQIAIGEHTLLVTGAHDVDEGELDRMKFRGRDLVTPDLGVYLTSEWTRKMTAPKSGPVNPDLPSLEVRGKVPSGLSATVKFIEAERATYAAAKAEADKLPNAWRWPHVLIGWPDRGVINVEVAARVVSYMLAQLKAGKVVDTGCAGAHGRTGTLLAMLLIEEEKLDPEAAILAVRKRHCRKAIESAAQVRAIYGFAGKFATEEEVKRLS